MGEAGVAMQLSTCKAWVTSTPRVMWFVCDFYWKTIPFVYCSDSCIAFWLDWNSGQMYGVCAIKLRWLAHYFTSQVEDWFPAYLDVTSSLGGVTNFWVILIVLYITVTVTNLVPRSSHRLGFAVRTNGRGRPGQFYHVNDVSLYQGRQREEGSSIERTHFVHTFFVLNQGGMFLLSKCSKLQRLGQKLQDSQACSNDGQSPPPSFCLPR